MTKSNTQMIRAESYLVFPTDSGRMVKLAELPDQQRSDIGTCLQIKFLNTVFAGEAHFYVQEFPDKEEMFP